MLVVGMGNPLKSDDNIGNLIAEKLDCEKIIAESNPEAYVSKMKNYKKIIFIDAVDFNAEPGSVKMFKINNLDEIPFSTHGIPVSFFRKMLPDSEIFVIGIQPKSLEFGTELFLDVEEVLKKVKLLI